MSYDWFTTATLTATTLTDFITPAWFQLFGDSYYHSPFNDDDERMIVDSAASDLPTTQVSNHIDDIAIAMDNATTVNPLPTTTFPTTPFPMQLPSPSPPLSPFAGPYAVTEEENADRQNSKTHVRRYG